MAKKATKRLSVPIRFRAIAFSSFLEALFILILMAGGSSWAQEPIDGENAPRIESNQNRGEELEIRRNIVRALIKDLKDKNSQVNKNGMEALRTDYPKETIPILAKELRISKSDDFKRRAAKVLFQISLEWGQQVPSEAKTSLEDLSAALNDRDEKVRTDIVIFLGNMGKSAENAVPYLIPIFKNDPQTKVRISATDALGNIGLSAKSALPDLIDRLKNDDKSEVRASAAAALGNISESDASIVPDLIEALNNDDWEVRNNAAIALGKMGKLASDAVPDLLTALKDPHYYVRGSAAVSLGKIGESASDAVPELLTALKDPHYYVRGSAAFALGNMGTKAKNVLPDLVHALKDSHYYVQNSAADALGNIAFSFQLSQENPKSSEFDKALKILGTSKNHFSKQQQAAVKFPLTAIQTNTENNSFVWSRKYQLLLAVILYLFLPVIWSFLLCIRPLWLLSLNEKLKEFDIPVPWSNGIVIVSVRVLILLKLFAYLPRVLDAWVNSYLTTVREEFQKKGTVRYRRIRIPIPVVLDGKQLAQLTAKDLESTFDRKHCYLLIWGEGGAGKTSLACQIALWAMSDVPAERLCKHPMLPVLIEQELDLEAKSPLIEAIQSQLKKLTDEVEPISDELLQHLLKGRRILVIVDHFSEMSEDTRLKIRPDRAHFPVNALVMTSRSRERQLGTAMTLEPQRITSDRLEVFMKNYLAQRYKPDCLTDREFLNARNRLIEIVGSRNITVMLAKLYAEHLIAIKKGTSNCNSPTNVPDLMLSYLNELNRNVAGNNKLDDTTVQQDAKAIAWECLQQSFCSTDTNKEIALTALKGNNPKNRLNYLKDRLRLIQTIGVEENQIRFDLHPLAEYLAGLHLIDIYGNNQDSWRDFWDKAKSMPAGIILIKGFLLAVQDCCAVRRIESHIPKDVAKELAKSDTVIP
jgi:HEAT repeat protein